MNMTDIGTIEKRTVYRIPEEEGFHSPYVGKDHQLVFGVDGDMMPVEQDAIPWCTFHKRPLGTGAGGDYLMSEVCAAPPTETDIPEIYDCVISTGGPEHKWWVDV